MCADPTSAATAERELRSLAAAGRSYRKATKRLLTLTQDALPAAAPRDVVAEPAYVWMLSASAAG